MSDTSINNSSESITAVACSPASLVTLRDRNNKAWMVQKELFAWVHEEDFLRDARSALGMAVPQQHGLE
ncbi:hypothetical protein [Pantoea ananatis]|uniref:hypothetical protein n=1 Tax=Pantoea ananas TaxID=553 RepID=UPI001B30CBD5|nr:hypothetical protein [Pantoea ananatis]